VSAEERTQYWACCLQAGDTLHVGGAYLDISAVGKAETAITVVGLLDERPCVWVLQPDDVVTFDRPGGFELDD
jgi:hypothetical protein